MGMRSVELKDEEYAALEAVAKDYDVSVRELLLRALIASAPHDTRLVALAAQVHDLGHGPFSHQAESENLEMPVRHTEGVMGGAACIRSTRIPVWMLVMCKMSGMADGDILRAYPSLDAADLHAAWTYFAAHPAEIEHSIQENDSDAAEDEELG